MSETTRWALPLLDAGQAQKEMTHNEALARLDLLTAAGVVAIGVDVPPASPAEGQCWIVGGSPSGAWAGQARALAGWTAGGWRFVLPREGLSAWSAAEEALATYAGGQWRVGEVRIGGVKVVGARQTAITAPAGGTTVDAEARTALGAVLAALRAHGLIAT